jgi:hypothetical protein
MKFKNIIIIGLSIAFLFSCKKKEKEEVSPDWASASDQSIGNALWQDIYKMVDENAQSEGVSSIRSCGTVSLNPISGFPTTLTIDFGTVGCRGTDGRYRIGKVEAVFTGLWRDSLTVVTVTPTNYYVDGYKVEGTKTIENKGHVGGNLTYDVAVTNGKITAPDNTSFHWNSNIQYEWIAGEGTTFITHGLPGVLDDVYLIRGNYNGVNRQGSSFSSAITTPIRKQLSCKWPVSGVLEITPQGLQTRVINFGNGSCDNDATVSVGSFSAVVQMR